MIPSAVLQAPLGVYDVENGGPGMITDVTTFDGVPAAARVYCLDRRTKAIVRAVVSAANGEYTLANLRTDRSYQLVADDLAENYNSVVLDRITPGF